MLSPVVIVQYDPQWPEHFEKEKAQILSVIGRWAVAVEHVGSTAVPKLAAKPIVDMLVGIEHLNDAEHCIGPLQRLGYEYVPEYEAVLPERRYFRKPGTRHLHMVEVDGDFWRRHVAFRDYLRAHPQTAHEYEVLKRELAAEFQLDRTAYTNAKSDFIQEVLARVGIE